MFCFHLNKYIRNIFKFLAITINSPDYVPKMMNRNEYERHFCTLLKLSKIAKSQYLFNERKKYDEVVMETQVLGVKPPQICKKTKEKCPKVWGMQKTNYKRKKRKQKKLHQSWKQFSY